MGFLLTASGGTEPYRTGSPGVVSRRERELEKEERKGEAGGGGPLTVLRS